MGNVNLDSEPLCLLPHPRDGANAVKALNAILCRRRDRLEVTYVIEGPTDALVLPSKVKPYRIDGLWSTTCLELFILRDDEEYLEFNFSPSTQWAAYRFSSYREGMEPLLLDEPPSIFVSDEGYALIVTVIIDVPLLPAFKLGLSAVIEELDGTKSYWALRHPPGDRPDFHHPDCFAIELPPATAP